MELKYHLYTTLPFFILTSIGLFGIFNKAGEQGWKAFVPVLNILVWLKLVGRKSWWVFLFFVPVLNFIMGISIALDLVKSFGKFNFGDQLLAVIFPFFYFPYLGFNKKDKYISPYALLGKDQRPKKSELREWADAILFAGTAALVIRTFMIEAFMIPTTSMEGSLLAGDFLFVSKFHYGVRLPMVPLSVPFIHNTLPVVGGKSYSEAITLPYSRLPGIKEVERNDIVVFNYPANDITADVGEDFKVKPVSMKQNYIKRCVAVAGDKFEIRDRQVYINDQPGWNPEFLQQKYDVIAREPLSAKALNKVGFRWKREKVKIKSPNGRTFTQEMPDRNNNVFDMENNHYLMDMSVAKKAELEGWPAIKSITPTSSYMDDPKSIYPYDPRNFDFTRHNYGPIIIPKRGETVKLSPQNIALYKRIIEAYEEHDLKIENGVIKIDGTVTDQYTFEMNYYWMMGDNRDGSLDSRFWGFVPENHIVGRPWFVLISFEDGIRWDRIFSPITRWEDQ
ncbi:MAG: signal peptidase I [Bacteroidia bacterium]|nr:signal peptidase I [Bacteroidia bacterium]